MKKILLLKKTLINFSFGISAVRGQGNGIVGPIRDQIIKIFSPDEFFLKLKSDNPKDFSVYLNKLTLKIVGLEGTSTNGKFPGVVQWGTARKCINLVCRTFAYNIFMCEYYGLKSKDFLSGGMAEKLELPLDSHVVKGIKKDCGEFEIKFDRKKYSKFSIIGLNKLIKNENSYYQNVASEIASKRGMSRIDLDLIWWRGEEN